MKYYPKIWLILSSLTLMLGSSNVFASPPFLSDSPTPTDYQHVEFYFALNANKNNHDADINFPSLEMDYGIFPDIEIDISPTALWYLPHLENDHRAYGLGDTQLSVKYRFLHETSTYPELAIVPSITLPTGEVHRNLGNGSTSFTFPVWAEKSWGTWTVDAGGGYTQNNAAGADDNYFGGLLVLNALSEKLSLGGEIFSQGSTSVYDKSNTLLNFGLSYNISPALSLLASAGHSILGANNMVTYWGVYWHC